MDTVQVAVVPAAHQDSGEGERTPRLFVLARQQSGFMVILQVNEKDVVTSGYPVVLWRRRATVHENADTDR